MLLQNVEDGRNRSINRKVFSRIRTSPWKRRSVKEDEEKEEEEEQNELNGKRMRRHDLEKELSLAPFSCLETGETFLTILSLVLDAVFVLHCDSNAFRPTSSRPCGTMRVAISVKRDWLFQIRARPNNTRRNKATWHRCRWNGWLIINARRSIVSPALPLTPLSLSPLFSRFVTFRPSNEENCPHSQTRW